MSTPHISNIALWKEEVRQEWTAAAVGWRKWHRQMEMLSRAATEAIMQAAQVTPGMHVLDLASGTGEPALSLALAVGPAGAVTATDLVPEMLAAAADDAQQRHVTNITFQQADAETLPFPAQTFDVVTCRMRVMLFANVAQARASGMCTKSHKKFPGLGLDHPSSTGRIGAKRGHASVSTWSTCP